MRKLLNIDANAKTVKGIKHGFSTAVLYLAPYKTSGINVCPFAEKAGCWQTCLNTAGRGGMAKRGAPLLNANGIMLPDNAIQRARIWRTQFWANDREGFLKQLVKEISAFVASAKRKGLTPIVRLNGTSDIQWENVLIVEDEESGHPQIGTIFERFPDVQFYDYTKIPKRMKAQATDLNWPSNYYLCLSYSEADEKYTKECWKQHWDHGASLVKVVRNQAAKDAFTHPIVDGDEHDLRFLDPAGAIVVLKAKGSARKETNGFVLD